MSLKQTSVVTIKMIAQSESGKNVNTKVSLKQTSVVTIFFMKMIAQSELVVGNVVKINFTIKNRPSQDVAS